MINKSAKKLTGQKVNEFPKRRFRAVKFTPAPKQLKTNGQKSTKPA